MKILYITTIGGTMRFFESLVKELLDAGNIVDIATNEDASDVPSCYREWNCKVWPISCTRSPLNGGNLKAVYEIREIVKNGNYDIVHCHTPIAAACTRLACRPLRKKGVKVFYTAHGFHFYKGAPLKNWLIYYPIEKLCAHWTDVLITINKEDYKLAKEHFKAKEVKYVPGVGVDIEKFKPKPSGRERIRTELGANPDQTILLSVGELNANNNYELVIRALQGLDVIYVIVGKGNLEVKLKDIAQNCSVDVRMMGYRKDVADFYDAADFYILPSLYEGLNVSLMEAMASSLPCLVGNMRGNVDIVDEKGGYLYNPESVEGIRKTIEKAFALDKEQRWEKGSYNLNRLRLFDLHNVKEITDGVLEAGGYKHLIELLKWQQKRIEIGIPLDAKLLLSVGELSVRKNHRVVVEALQKLNSSYWYVIVGKGSLRDELEKLDHTNRLKLIGYRTDIGDLLKCSDLFVFPSLQEGLPVALMEAMAAGVNVLCSDIRGNADLIERHLLDPEKVDDWKCGIEKAMKDDSSAENLNRIQAYSVSKINAYMKEMYAGIMNDATRFLK